MRLLVLYGHHIEEKDFGKRVCEEYQKRFSPDKNKFLAVTVTNPTKAGSSNEERPLAEIIEYIKKHKPKFFVNLHHSKGTSKKQEKEESPLTKYLKKHYNSTQEIKSPLIENILIEYYGEGLNDSFFECFEDVFTQGIMALPEKSNASIHHQLYEGAQKLNTHYIVIEAILEGREWDIFDNETNRETFENTLQILHRLQKYTDKL